MAHRLKPLALFARLTRRRFVTSAAAGALVAGTSLAALPVAGGSRLRVSAGDPMAKALSYAHDAKSVDAAIRTSNSSCHSCALFAGKLDDDWAGCSVFPGRVVAGAGWCRAWSEEKTE